MLPYKGGVPSNLDECSRGSGDNTVRPQSRATESLPASLPRMRQRGDSNQDRIADAQAKEVHANKVGTGKGQKERGARGEECADTSVQPDT